MLLSYYDSYLNDNIIEEKYDAVSEGDGTNMVERDCSPGVLAEPLQDKELLNIEFDKSEYSLYFERMKEMKETHFQAMLFEIGKKLLEEEEEEEGEEKTFGPGTNLSIIKNILIRYLNYIKTNNSNLQNLEYKICTKKQFDGDSELDIKKFIKKQIDLGYPVIVHAKGAKSHVYVCYDYYINSNENIEEDRRIDAMTFYGHKGWWKPEKEDVEVHAGVPNGTYHDIEGALVLKFPNLEHSCSNNYIVGDVEDGETYCYCSNNIYTTNVSEWTDYILPNSFDGNLVVPNWVTGINTQLFCNNQDIISLTYEANSSLNSIGAEAFKGCGNLMYVEIPKSVTTIGAWAFGNTVKLESVFFEQGSNLETICSSAFRQSELMSITLPQSLRTIEPYAFNLTQRLTSITVPSSVTSIGISAFGNGDLLGNSNLTIYTDRTDIPSSGDGWQQNWNAIVDYSQSVPPGSGGYTKNSVFFGCTLSSDKSYVKSVTRTSNNLLYPNASNIYNSPSREGYGFGGWYSNSSYSGTEYTTAEIAAKTSGTYYIKWIPNLLQYNLLSDGTYEVEMTASTIGGDLEIPSEYNGKPVTKIAENGFRECVNLVSVSFPYTVTTIGANAFRDCTSLESLDMPFVQVIEDYAFYGCQNLTATNFYLYAEEVGAFAFGCTDIRGLIVTTSVEYVGLFAFKDCENLQFVNLKRTSESGVTWIESTAFEGCIELFVIDTPDVDSYYDYYAQFEGNDWLTLRLVCLELI